MCLFPAVCVELFIICLQARGGGGEVCRPAPPPPADISGQANHQQRDGARKDEARRATDAAKKPCGGETPLMKHGLFSADSMCAKYSALSSSSRKS